MEQFGLLDSFFQMFDEMIAEKLEVDVETFIRVIESENVSDEEQEQIIMGVMEGDENDIQKAKELFELKLSIFENKLIISK